MHPQKERCEIRQEHQNTSQTWLRTPRPGEGNQNVPEQETTTTKKPHTTHDEHLQGEEMICNYIKIQTSNSGQVQRKEPSNPSTQTLLPNAAKK